MKYSQWDVQVACVMTSCFEEEGKEGKDGVMGLAPGK